MAAANAVITTASIPGRAAPRIITREMVEAMKPGSVVVDLAAESGGNCELTEAGRTVNHGGVLVAGPTNIASSIPIHATEMYAKNLLNFLTPQIKEGALELDWEDEVLIGSVLTHAGEVRHEPTRAQLDSA